MEVKYVNPFIGSAKNIFATMMKVSIIAGKPYLRDDNAENMYDISGVIGLTGETQGAVVISFPKLTALKTVTAFSGIDVKIFDQIVVDAVGEIINIISGNAKKDLAEFRLQISLPSVVVGNNHKINWTSGVPVICVPFESELGDFVVSVSLKDIDVI